MVAFQRLLVPTDFSDCAGRALDEAIRLALETGGKIDLAHSCFIPNLYQVATPPEVEHAIRDSAAAHLATLVDRARKAGVDTESHLLDEAPAKAIAQLATHLGSDCIVMGTLGRTGLEHVVLGSTAERTLRAAPCPVLTIGPEAREGHALPEKIVVPMDFEETAEHAAEVARELLSRQPGGEVVLLHVYSQPIATGPYAFAAHDAFAGLRERIAQALEERAIAFTEAGIDTSVRVEEAPSAPAEIARVAEEEDCDWIVMGTHGRTGLSHLALGSIAERVVRAAVCPTLTVRKDT